jgi:L-ascorbate metabolism protein UlaG (beta-lactamase superfamily)
MKLILILLLLNSLAQAETKYPLSDHYDGKVFFNPDEHHMHTLWDILKWKLTADTAEWPQTVANNDYPLPMVSAEQRSVVTFINHATFLIQLKDLNILTDPLFAKRASPMTFMGPKRIREPGIQLEMLPKIDVVIISHNHYDHLDLEALKQLDAKFHPLMLVPLGDEKLLKEAGIQNVREMDWWQEQEIREHKIVFTPSQHWSARGLFDKCESLWGSYFILSPDFKLYFGGDSGYGPHFGNIRLRLGAPDVSLLPIGAYAPRYFMKYHHMEPEEAVKAHADLNSNLSIGMHFGTFQLTDEAVDEPVERLKKTGENSFITLDQGESKNF